jgi:16S rRNA (adenine1518-N6/adenine1519-N6)-dimethyltransferase
MRKTGAGFRPGTGFRPRRSLGQNFLVNEGALDAIVRAFDPRPEDVVLEIGPGQGALTRRVAGRVARLVAVEVDPLLAAGLRETLVPRLAPGSFEVLEADILALPPATLLRAMGASAGRPGRVLANLPYNIATAVILALLPLRPALADLMVMVQREVAQRIRSAPGPKAYGSLSVLCQAFARVDSIVRLGPGSFRPRPAVDSEVIRLTLKDPGGAAGSDIDGFARLVRAAFASRRKTLLNNLAAVTSPSGRHLGAVEAEALARGAGLDPGRRAEAIPVAGFLALHAAWTDMAAARGL